MSHPSLQSAKGVFHLQYMALRMLRYWKLQSVSLTPVALPDPGELFQALEYQLPWEPTLSVSLRAKLNLDSLGMLAPPSLVSLGRGETSTTSDLTHPTLPTLEAFARALASGLGGGTVGGGGGGGTRGGSGGGGGREGGNPQFNDVLFGEYRRRLVNGKPVRAWELRLKIANGELPELPQSKHGDTPMCPAWHIKGMCNQSCPRVHDHKDYSVDDYAPLVKWCSDNYPS